MSKIFIINPSDSFEHFQYMYTKFSPGYKSTNYLPSGRWVGVDSILRVFKTWLEKDISDYLNENIDIDLWHEYQNSGEAFNINKIDFNENELFKVDEQKQLGMALNELKLLIESNFNTTQQQQGIVTERLNYLTEASKKQTKFVWKSIAISTLISISIALTLDTEQGLLLF